MGLYQSHFWFFTYIVILLQAILYEFCCRSKQSYYEKNNHVCDVSGLRPQLSALCLVSSPQKHSLDVGYNVSPGLSVQS